MKQQTLEIQPKQRLLLECPAQEILFGGAKGGGKSFGLLLAIVQQAAIAGQAWELTGIPSTGFAVIFRKTFTRLGDLVRKAKRLFRSVDAGFEWNETAKRGTFSSGYVVQFAQLANPDAHEDWNGQEITLLGVDEGEDIPAHQYDFLCMQVRSADPVLKPHLKKIVTANPLGKHIKWIKDRFVKGKVPGEIYEERYEIEGVEVVTTRTFIKSRISDNRYLYADRAYVATLMKLPAAMRAAYLDGDWDAVVGGFFDQFDPKIHVGEIRTVPRSWELWIAGDWGSRAPACALLMGQDPDGNNYVIAEKYGPGGTGREWGEKLLAWFEVMRLDPNELVGPLDSEAWNNYGSEVSPGDRMNQMGLRWLPAEKGPGSRASGLVEIKERMNVRWCPECKGSMKHQPGCSEKLPQRPALFIDRRCENLIEQLSAAVPDLNKPDDIDKDCEIHAIDALNYGCGWRPLDEKYRVKVDETLEEWQSMMAKNEVLRRNQERVEA